MTDDPRPPAGATGWQPRPEDAGTARSAPWERSPDLPAAAAPGPESPAPSGTPAADEDDWATIVVPPLPAEPASSAPAGAAAEPAASAPPRDLVRLVARGVGQTLITAGLVVLLFVVYELWITDIFSEHKQAAATAAMDQAWQSAAVAPASGTTPSVSASVRSSASPSGRASGSEVVTVTDPDKLVTDPRTRKVDYQTETGQGFAKIYIPSFGPDYVYTVIEGTNADDLDVGPGHYEDTQLPGQPGNFAMAGHRVSKGSPFNALGQLNSCDALVVETRDDWFVYRVLPMQNEVSGWKAAAHAGCSGVTPLTGAYQGVFGREITDPSDYAQVEPVPHVNSAAVPANALRLITLTTCHPQFSDAQRMIIHGVLTTSYKKAAGFVPPELKG